MGTILEGKCAKCGYQAAILVGGGLRDCDPKTALSAAPGDLGLAGALGNHGQFRIERFPAICTRCHKLLAPPQVTYWAQDGAEHVIPAVCPDCGGPLRRGGGELPCPVCGGPLELLAAGQWD